MAYPSKIERYCRWRDYRHGEWVRSLAGKSTNELQADLEAIEALLARTPKRHVHRISDIQANIRILQFTIAKRKAELLAR